MKIFFYLIFILLLTTCTSITQNCKQTDESILDKKAYSLFGEKFDKKANAKGSHILVFKKFKKIEELMATINFFIYEKETQSIIFQDELKAGSVNWSSDFEIFAIARNLSEDENKNKSSTLKYYYNVIKKEKRIINSN